MKSAWLKILSWYQEAKENQYCDVNLWFVKFFIDFRKWYFIVFDNYVHDSWFHENELTDEEKSGIKLKDDDGQNYRCIPVYRWFNIKIRWHNYIRDNTFKIGLILGLIIGLII